MATQQFPSIPLESLVAHLRQEGFVLDTRAVLNLQVVLRNFAQQIKDPAKDLPRWIGPIVCRNADEQRKLVQACAAFFLDQERLMAAERRAAEEKERQEAAERQKRQAQRAMLRKYLLWGTAIVLPLAMLGFFLAVQWQPLKLGKASLERSNTKEITVGDTVRFQASMAETDTSAGRTWLLNGEQLPGNGLGQTLHFDSIGNFNLQLIREKTLLWRGIKDTSSTLVQVECKGKPHWQLAEPLVEGTLVKFSALSLDNGPSQAGLSFRWDFGDGNTSNEPSPAHDYGQTGDFTYTLSVVDSTLYPDCPLELSSILRLEPPLDTTKAILPPFPSAATPNIYKVTLQLWWFFLPGILLGLLTYVLVLIWQRRRQRSEAKRDAEIDLELTPDFGSPYTIPWPNQDHRIAWDTVLDKLASAMTNRSRGEHFQLHVPASISATIAAGGLPSLRMQANTQSTQWLALVDEESQSAIELRLIKWLLRQLHTETVQLDVYCYRGIPTELYQEGKPQRHSLARLASLYPQHRLLIFSRGDGLLQAYRSELLPALRDAFRQWKHRSLLTPTPASTWGRKEAAISELFGVCPLQSEALLSYFQLPETPSGNDHPAWVHKLIRQWGIAPEMPRRIKSLQSLREATGTARRFEWAKATLASDTPHWELLLSAGDLLDNNQQRLSWDELFALSRLPFLRDGDVSPALQAEALAANNDPVLQTGRRAYRDLLVGAEEILKSNGHRGLAGAMVARELVVQNHRLDPNDEPTRLKLQKLVETGQHEEPGFVPKKPRRSIRPWEMGSVVASIATLLMVVVWMNYGSTRQDAPDQGLIFRVDSVPVQSPYFSWMDSMAQVYKSGEAAYLRGDYAPAINDFTRGVVMAGMDSLSPQVREELLGLGGIERGQVAFRAYFVNALGLCSHYAGDTANACLLLRAVLLSYPDFYEANRVQPPNLKTLTQCGGADWAGNVLDLAGAPIYGAKLKWNAFGPGYPSSVYTTGRNGDFVLSGPLLKPGDSLFFSAPNYQDTFALAPDQSQPNDAGGDAQKHGHFPRTVIYPARDGHRAAPIPSCCKKSPSSSPAKARRRAAQVSSSTCPAQKRGTGSIAALRPTAMNPWIPSWFCAAMPPTASLCSARLCWKGIFLQNPASRSGIAGSPSMERLCLPYLMVA
jgi:PKD repeat protein